MNNPSKALALVLEERTSLASSLPEKLLADIYAVEERVQFDEDRRDVVQKIRTIVQTQLDAEEIKGA